MSLTEQMRAEMQRQQEWRNERLAWRKETENAVERRLREMEKKESQLSILVALMAAAFTLLGSRFLEWIGW